MMVDNVFTSIPCSSALVANVCLKSWNRTFLHPACVRILESLWLAAAGLAMALYEVHWIRYFRSQRTMRDFYRSLLGIPVAGAVLPVLAFMLLAVYGKNPFLFGAAFLLGVGHIRIHLEHSREAADI